MEPLNRQQRRQAERQAKRTKSNFTVDPILMQMTKLCYIWQFQSKNLQTEINLLKKMAYQQKLYFQIFSSNSKFKLLQLKGITYPVTKILKQQLKIPNELFQLFPPIIEPQQVKWEWMKCQIINQYGSFEIESQECQICFSRCTNAMQTCCGKSLCSKCDINKQTCAFCQQELLNIHECYRDQNITVQSLRNMNSIVQNIKVKR